MDSVTIDLLSSADFIGEISDFVYNHLKFLLHKVRYRILILQVLPVVGLLLQDDFDLSFSSLATAHRKPQL